MLRTIVFLLSPLIAVALVYWLGAMALLGCLALVLGSFLLSTAGPKAPATPIDAAECCQQAMHRRGAHMARS